jgi:hypothetical protein
MRLSAPLFGYSAPPIMGLAKNQDAATKDQVPYISAPDGDQTLVEEPNRVYLDNAYDRIMSLSYLILQAPGGILPVVAQAQTVQIHPRTAYGMSGKTTDIVLVGDPNNPVWNVDDMGELRGVQVYAQSEPLTLVDEPISRNVGFDQKDPAAAKSLTLDTPVDGLQAGRWLIVEGQRADVPGTDTVTAAELVMLEGVDQGIDPTLPTDTVHSTLRFANQGLAYSYKRDTVSIYANVAHATNGETRVEVLGSGDAARSFQAFMLKQSPLTYISAPTPSGVQSTLEVRVNGLRWHEVDNLAFVGRTDRSYVTSIEDHAQTTVTFGDGAHGVRLPTGVENVTATYRNGIGKPGNVKAGQVSLLATKPLGIKDVINPIRASGGADAESRDQARENVSLATLALDRLVSVQDYAYFARTFAGVGKAAAVKLGSLVQVTIAGADDIPIDITSDLFRNLGQALRAYGDPSVRVRIDVRELLAVTLSAKVGLLPDYTWELVEPQVRRSLLDTFGFQRRALAQHVYLSEIISCIQTVRGVSWVDVDLFGSIDQSALLTGFGAGDKDQSPGTIVARAATGSSSTSALPPPRIEVKPGGYDRQGKLHGAQIAYFIPDVPDTLLLQEAGS